MKFAHMADCHIGSWRDPKLRDASVRAFVKAIDMCISKEVDFILISGDLFNTSLPGIDWLKIAVGKLKQLNDKGINVYVIAGSHDFSPSGRTMLDVLEEAGLLINVVKGEIVGDKLRLKFTVDKKTGAKITGMLGKKGQLERKYYQDIIREGLENEKGYKIFMFHSALTELKPKEMEHMESQPISLLPKGFNYYAGGHVHIIKDVKIDGYGTIVYPGPLFPNNFKELEQLKNGGMYIVEDDKLKYEPILIYNVESITIDCSNKMPEQIKKEIIERVKNKEFYDTIVTIRLEGILESGKPSDIDFKEIFNMFYDKSAYFVMKSSSKLMSKEFEEIKIKASTIEEAEEALIKEHLGQMPLQGMDKDNEAKITRELIRMLSIERGDGERVSDFDNRITKEAAKAVGFRDLES